MKLHEKLSSWTTEELVQQTERRQCHLCKGYIEPKRQCTCSRFKVNHCAECHFPAILLSLLPAAPCGVTLHVLSRDSKVDKREIRAALMAIERLFHFPVYRATLAATKHGRGSAEHFWVDYGQVDVKRIVDHALAGEK